MDINGNGLGDMLAALRRQHQHELLAQMHQHVADHGPEAELPLHLKPTSEQVEGTVAWLVAHEGWHTPEAKELVEAWHEDATLADIERTEEQHGQG